MSIEKYGWVIQKRLFAWTNRDLIFSHTRDNSKLVNITSKYFNLFNNKPPASWVAHITVDFLTCYSCSYYSSMIKHIFLLLHPCVRMLFTFEAFSLSFSVLGTIPDIKTLFVSVFQFIPKWRIPIVVSSGVSIVFKSFVRVCRMMLSGFC